MRNYINIGNFKRIMALVVMLLSVIIVFGAMSVNAASLTATGKVNSKDGAILRKSASTTSASIKVLENNTQVTIKKEVFTTKASTAKVDRWYYVTAGKKSGYIRVDLIDTIKYSSSAKATTTEALNYRKGAGEKMPVVDTFKKGATVTKVLPAKAYNDSASWYKIKRTVNKKTKYYYVCGSYLKSGSGNTDGGNTDAKVDPDKKFDIATSSDFSKIQSNIIQGQFCVVRGTISCTHKITKVRAGVKKSTGSWVSGVNSTIKDVNSKSFDLLRVDSAIKFGKLDAGSYKFCVYIWANNAVHSVTSQSFKVINIDNAKWPDKIAQEAISLAWPPETTAATYAYVDGAPTPQYSGAISSAFAGALVPKNGADCGVFVATVIRASGYDQNYPYSLTSSKCNMFDYLADDTSRWVKISYSGKESELQSGDVVIYRKSGGGQHVLIYVRAKDSNGIERGYTCEAANVSTKSKCKYGYMNDSYGKIFKLSDKTIEVYRAIQ